MTAYQCGEEEDNSHHRQSSKESSDQHSRKATELQGTYRESPTQEKHHQRHT